MTTLVLGASGSTGTHLVDQLLKKGLQVKVIVRPNTIISDTWKDNKDVQIIEANVLEISEDEMAEKIKDCSAVASCLGHNMSWKGIYGEPRKLVADAAHLLCNAIKKNKPNSPIRLALMSTTAYVNKDLNEPNSFIQRIVIGLLRLLLPPHIDNEEAADYLWTHIGQKDEYIEWVSVRPYDLINEEVVSEYEVNPSPSRSVMFDPRKSRRINVGHFMAELITKDGFWEKWKGQMPVIYDKTDQDN